MTVIEWRSERNSEMQVSRLGPNSSFATILCVTMDKSFPPSSVAKSVEWAGRTWYCKGHHSWLSQCNTIVFPQCPQAFLLNLFIICFEAPLGSVVSNHLSCQVGIMLGGLLASTGLILGSFATSLKHLYLTLGVLTGKGTLHPSSHPIPFRFCQSHQQTHNA